MDGRGCSRISQEAPNPLIIPASLAANCGANPVRSAWLASLPATARSLALRWKLTFGEPFADATCAWVAPARRADGSAAVLKLGMPHFEAQDEIQGLRFWNGEPTVLLLESDEQAGAMLLESCTPGSKLSAQPEDEQDVVIAQLLRRLWSSPGWLDVFRPLSLMIRHWIDETLANSQFWSDPHLVRDGLQAFEELSQSESERVLLATDLHAGNVLRSQREPWLVIDPKPFIGDPAFDSTQHLLNCRASMMSDAEGKITRFADLLQVDRERVRRWLFARAAAEPRSVWREDDLTQLAQKLSKSIC